MGSTGGRAVDVIVIGAGQAGVSLSYFLRERGIEHVILERSKAFSAWRNRWDGFVANTPNWMNTLPMLPANETVVGSPNDFAARDEIVAYLEACLNVVDPPLIAGVEVTGVSSRGPYEWAVQTQDDEYNARFVAVCTGAMSAPWTPSFAADLSSDLPQLHSNQYRHPSQIQTSRVLVVGSGSSGVQISRLLAEDGRFDEVHLATSKVLVLPKQILRIPTHRLIHSLGLFDLDVQSLLGRLVFSKLGAGGDPIVPPTPRQLSRRLGVVLHSRMTGSYERTLLFGPEDQLVTDDLTIVWCTGLRGDYRFIDEVTYSQVFQDGVPRHERGIVKSVPGLYFVGLRHQHTAASHDIYGVGADADYIARHIGQTLKDQRGHLVSS